jgi:membrane protein
VSAEATLAGTPEVERRPSVWRALKQATWEWLEDNAFTWAAAIAFYTVFSLAPLLIIATTVAGAVWGRAGVRQGLHQQFEQTIGERGARQVEEIIDRTGIRRNGRGPALIGGAAMVLGATAVFGTVRAALDAVWNVREREFNWRVLVLHRLLSFAMVLSIAFLLIVSLIVSAALVASGRWIDTHVPLPISSLRAVNVIGSWIVFGLLFAALFKWLPDAHVAWKDVWVGASLTSLLFAVGKLAIGYYLGHSTVASAYGAAGSLAVLLLWIYYSALIFLFGAELTQVYARYWGSRIRSN